MNWQDLIAIAIVTAAALYLARQAWLLIVRKQSGCGGGCKSCPTSGESTAEGKPLVTLGEIARGEPRR
jgi:hypothetical protein